MPQFDLAVFPAQIFWLVIFFSILMIYTVSVSVPRMKALLEERWQKTEGYRIEASRYSDDLKVTLQQVDAGVSQARQEAHDLIAQTQVDLNHEFSERKKEMLALIKAQMITAESNISAEKIKAVSAIKECTENITKEIISKLLPMGGSDIDIKGLLENGIEVKVSNGI